MSLVLAAALVATTPVAASVVAACSWDRPGHHPFTGDLVAAVDRYRHIPGPVRATLMARMAARQYDEIVSIRRDRVEGKARYDAELRYMHFGTGQVRGTATRARWADGAHERGLVYCESGPCLLVPTVCRNLSRITRQGPATAADGVADSSPLSHGPVGTSNGAGHGAGGGAGSGAGGGATDSSFSDGAGGWFGGDGAVAVGRGDRRLIGSAALPLLQGSESGLPSGGGPVLPSPTFPLLPAPVPPPVPEPASALLLLAGLGVVGAWVRRRRPG